MSYRRGHLWCVFLNFQQGTRETSTEGPLVVNNRVISIQISDKSKTGFCFWRREGAAVVGQQAFVALLLLLYEMLYAEQKRRRIP